MAERDYERIGPTAHYTAYVWYRAGFPYGELFRTRRGAFYFHGFRALGEGLASRTIGVPTLERYLMRRHTLIEQALWRHDPDHLVELGAGLSRRGICWAADRQIPVLEVDLPHMIAAKRGLIEERAPRGLKQQIGGRFEQLPLNLLSESFPDRLAEALRSAARPAVVAEGLLSYFPMDARLQLVRGIASGLRARGGGSLYSEIHCRPTDPALILGMRVLRAGIRLVTEGRGVRGGFADPAAVRRFFLEAGFEEAAPVPTEELPPELKSVKTDADIWRAQI